MIGRHLNHPKHYLFIIIKIQLALSIFDNLLFAFCSVNQPNNENISWENNKHKKHPGYVANWIVPRTKF